jgi:TonB family protein
VQPNRGAQPKCDPDLRIWVSSSLPRGGIVYTHPGSVSFAVNVEASIETTTEFWPKWQSEVINGVYPLRRLLNGSDQSAVFLTECKAHDVATAAIKIVPAERVTLAQLSHWRTAAGLSHPHLIRLLDAGLCQLGGRQFLFVVMEYAEQTLSEVLMQRALTADEVQEMLPPILDALAFLHAKSLVQGQLKPANVLVVNDQVKLASDTVRPAGEPRASAGEASAYDPPEAEGGRLSPAGDIWALGITLVEALTRRVPASPDKESVTASLPTTVAPTLVDTVRRCLSHDPGSRPTAIALEAPFRPAPQVSGVSAPQAVVRDPPDRAAPPPEAPKQRALAPLIAGVLITLGAVWAGLRLFQSQPSAKQPAASTVRPSSQQGASAPAPALQIPERPLSVPPKVSAPLAGAKSRASKPALPRPVARQSDQPAPELADASVVHEEIPSVPRSARETIHGHVKVTVRVIVDRSGNVIDALLENPGPSRYFARQAKEAAGKWRFAAADNEDSRVWLLRFEFGRGGTTVHPVTAQP